MKLSVILGFVTIVALMSLKGSLELYHKYKHIPTCGGADLPVVSWPGAMRYLFRAVKVLEEGYNKMRDHPFKIAQFTRWMIIVASPELISDVTKASEDTLSFHDATSELLQMPYTLGSSIAENPYHIPLIRRTLSHKNVFDFHDVVQDEVATAVDELLMGRTNSDSWSSIRPSDFAMGIIGRANSRVLVGLPLCRHPEYLQIVKQFTLDVLAAGAVIERFPVPLRSYISKLFPRVHSSISKVADLISPVVEAKQNGPPEDNTKEDPQAFLDSLLQEAQGVERTPINLSRRLMAVNFAAMHTTSTSFVQSVLHLAERPECALELREEVEAITNLHGWTVNGIKHMKKVDSFLVESQRINPLGAVLMQRVVRKPFTFSDGTSIPIGTTIGVAVTPVHRDPENYPAAHEFRPFEDGNASQVYSERRAAFLAFGQGRHACPGRFFASLEMKVLLAHLVLSFDFKLPETLDRRPENIWIGSTCIPDPGATVLVRRRIKE